VIAQLTGGAALAFLLRHRFQKGTEAVTRQCSYLY